MTPALTAPQQRVRRIVLGTWTLLFILVCMRQLQQGVTATQILWAMLFALPMLLPLPGLVRGKRYTHSWATLCVLPYFIVGVTEGVANSLLRNWALALLGASLLWFFAMLAFLRVTPAAPPVAPAN